MNPVAKLSASLFDVPTSLRRHPKGRELLPMLRGTDRKEHNAYLP